MKLCIIYVHKIVLFRCPAFSTECCSVNFPWSFTHSKNFCMPTMDEAARKAQDILKCNQTNISSASGIYQQRVLAVCMRVYANYIKEQRT